MRIRDELDQEPTVAPGTKKFGDTVYTWSDHRIRIVRSPTDDREASRLAFGPGDVTAVQVSRSHRAVADVPCDFLDVEFRGSKISRLRLSALCETDELEGLPYYDSPGEELDSATLRSLIAATRFMGAQVSQHGSAIAAPGDSSSALLAVDHHLCGPFTVFESRDLVRVDVSNQRELVLGNAKKAIIAMTVITAFMMLFLTPSAMFAGGAALVLSALWTFLRAGYRAGRFPKFSLEAHLAKERLLVLENQERRLEMPVDDIRGFQTRVQHNKRFKGLIYTPSIRTPDGWISLTGEQGMDQHESDALCGRLDRALFERGDIEKVKHDEYLARRIGRIAPVIMYVVFLMICVLIFG